MTNSTKDFTEEFNSRRKKFRPLAIVMVLYILIVLMVVPIILAVAGAFTQTSFCAYGLIAFIPGIFFTVKAVKFMRCPNCNKYMGLALPKFCPLCGAHIQK